MSEDTILGTPSSPARPVPEGVVPGEQSSGDRSPTGGSGSSEEDLRDWNPPGDPTTAYHRSRVYSVLALGFERPGGELQAAMDAEAFRTDLLESAQVVDGDIVDAAREVAETIEDPDELRDEWVSLYGVEDDVSVSPYELTYMPGPLMTNVRKLADLSGFYEAFDLEIVPERNDRQDHISFLLEFLGHLSLREAILREQDDDTGVRIVVDARRQFVEDHIGRWYWRFANEVSQQTTGFYASLADLLAALIEDEVDRLDADPDWVPDVPGVTEWSEDVFGDSGRGCGGCGISTDDVEGSAPAPPNPGTPDRRREG